MALLTENNIKSELSYAYLHAVASRAGLACEVAGRHSDGAGVDAVVRAKERFHADSVLTHFTVEIQLKATCAEPNLDARDRYPFALEIDHYDKLRDIEAGAQQILVVLFLPPDAERWLVHSDDALVSAGARIGSACEGRLRAATTPGRRYTSRGPIASPSRAFAP